jgi:hypothetical protein
MNKTIATAPSEAPSQLMGTLAIMGFAAEDNLRKVARALAQRDHRELSLVEERNAKQARLRTEVEEQVVLEMEDVPPGSRAHRKLLLASHLAGLFERMGGRTVELARLSDAILREPRPARVADLRKLIEHAVYITDRAATGLVEEDLEMAKIAQQQVRAALDLGMRIDRELATLAYAHSGNAARIDLLTSIACRGKEMIAEAGRLADDVVSLLQAPHL